MGCVCVDQEMDNVRGVSSLYKRVCAEDVKKVTVVNQAVRIIWDKENECWIHRGQDYLKSEDLKTIFPKAAIVTPYDRRQQDRYQGKDIKTKLIIIYTNF